MGAVKNHYHDELERRRLDIPEEWLSLTFDEWTGDYRDHFNNVFVTKGTRRLWAVTSREPGNTFVVHSRHRDCERALAKARDLLVDRHRP